MPDLPEFAGLNLSPLAQQMLAEFSSRRGRPAKLFEVSRRSCGCWLAFAYRFRVGDGLIGRRRALVQQTLNKAEAQDQTVVLPLSEAWADSITSEFSCRHANQVTLQVANVARAIEEAVAGTRKAGKRLLI